MTPTLLTATLATSLILLPGMAAAAGTGQQSWLQVFDQLDQDRDGALSRAEYERANSLQISTGPAQPPSQNPYLPASSQTGASSQPGQTPNLSGSGQQQAAGAPPRQSSLVAFENLDVDRNGYLNAVEALRSYSLLQSWNKVDANRDGLVERAEFSAFEQGGMR